MTGVIPKSLTCNVTAASRGNWMTTYSGGRFYPMDAHEDDINIVDVAHALSQLCRFGGHLKRFYSVAEHCVHVCRAAPVALKREALLHDASEAYLVDMPRPIKAMMPQYTEIERGIERVIARKFGLQYPWPQEIKTLDDAILLTEWNVFGNDAMWSSNGEKPLDVKLEGWSPGLAEMNFLDEAYTWV